MWRWLIPLLAAIAVFAGVLITTPPGFRAIADVLFGSLRGTAADAAAYAIGAAASLALAALVVLVLVCSGLYAALKRLR